MGAPQPNLKNRKMQQNMHIICMIQKNIVILQSIQPARRDGWVKT